MIQSAKRVQKQFRVTKTPVIDRPKQYAFFIDFKNAFDAVNKNRLYEKMAKGGFSTHLVKAIKNLLTDTYVNYNGIPIETKRGTPQGSCLSPDLWNIYLADLCNEVEGVTTANLDNFLRSNTPLQGTRALFFADDTFIFC
jgi:retron-type reverse transcriptase